MALAGGQLQPEVAPVGDCAVAVRFGDRIEPALIRLVSGFCRAVEARPFPGFVEVQPAYTTATVFYDPVVCSITDAVRHVQTVLAAFRVGPDEPHRVVTIPVCYGGDYGPDLAHVAAHCGLSEEEVIALHSGVEYLVHAIGFAPGFPYLGGLVPELWTPRRPSPRLAVRAGSVGIAGSQTGVYPVQSPGGWQIIGRTPARLFRPDGQPPAMLAVGDRVRFVPIDADQFVAIAEVGG